MLFLSFYSSILKVHVLGIGAVLLLFVLVLVCNSIGVYVMVKSPIW